MTSTGMGGVAGFLPLEGGGGTVRARRLEPEYTYVVRPKSNLETKIAEPSSIEIHGTGPEVPLEPGTWIQFDRVIATLDHVEGSLFTIEFNGVGIRPIGERRGENEES